MLKESTRIGREWSSGVLGIKRMVGFAGASKKEGGKGGNA